MAGAPVKVPNEEQLLDRARALKESGMSWRRIAQWLDAGVGAEWFKRRLVPGHAEKMNARNALYNKGFRAQPNGSAGCLGRPRPEQPQPALTDTRDITGRIFGDPIYERSALAKKRAEADA